jgi:hypothetical protein
MATEVGIRFVPAHESGDADCWLVTSAGEDGERIDTYCPTVLDALDTALLMFRSSPELQAHYQDRAETEVLSINAPEIAARKQAMLQEAGLLATDDRVEGPTT